MQHLVVVVRSWDMAHYSATMFKDYYGDGAGGVFWQTALQATMDTKAAMRHFICGNRDALVNYWQLVAGWYLLPHCSRGQGTDGRHFLCASPLALGIPPICWPSMEDQ